MTIAIAVQVHDGVVLASDSATTLFDGNDQVVNVYNNANKIFNLKKGLPIGGLTYGMGSFGASSISTLVKDLRRRFAGDDAAHKGWALDDEKVTVEEVCNRTREFFFDEHYKSLNIPVGTGPIFGFVVAGYSANEPLSEVWLIEINQGNCPAPVRLMARGVTNAYAGGEPEVFTRLLNGHGMGLGDALKSLGMPDADVPGAVTAIGNKLGVSLVEAPMPIQDAIDFAEFIVHTTAMFTRFKRGAATVGGPIESAAITKHEGFKWVRRKHYFDTVLNPEGHE